MRLCVSVSLRETFWLRPSALVTLVTRNFSHSKKGVIPSFPPCLPCHPGKHQRAGHSSNLPPPPAVFPTADSSPRFARFGMTRERSCHPEERQRRGICSREHRREEGLNRKKPSKGSSQNFDGALLPARLDIAGTRVSCYRRRAPEMSCRPRAGS